MHDTLTSIILPLISIPFLLVLYWRLNVKLLKKYKSPLLGTIEVRQKYNGEKLLTINGYAQSVSPEQNSIKGSYWYAIAEQTLQFCQDLKNPKLLMFGLGAATIPHLIAKKDPQIQQTIIEIDPAMIQACREFFDLDSLPHCQVIQADAYKIVADKKALGDKFDVAIVDIYIGKPPFVSPGSNKPAFIEKVLSYLKTDGIIIFNRPGNTEEVRQDNFALKKYLSGIFKNTNLVDIKDPRGYRNHMVLAYGKKST